MLCIKVSGMVYSFTNLSVGLSQQIKKSFQDFVLDKITSKLKVDGSKTFFTVGKSFKNIWLFKTFFRKKLSRDLLNHNKLMVHSAVFTFRNKTFVFLGESEQGKSTIVGKVKDFATVFNDETNVLDVDNGVVYSTPFWGDNSLFSCNKSPFDRVFVLKKLNRNCIEEMNKQRALYHLLKTVLVDINSYKVKSKVLEIASHLVGKMNFYLFSYKLDTDLLDLLNRI